jgi:hypothetical protein
MSEARTGDYPIPLRPNDEYSVWRNEEARKYVKEMVDAALGNFRPGMGVKDFRIARELAGSLLTDRMTSYIGSERNVAIGHAATGTAFETISNPQEE